MKSSFFLCLALIQLVFSGDRTVDYKAKVDSLMEVGGPAMVLEVFQALLKKSPEDARLLNIVGLTTAMQGNGIEGEKLLKQSIEIDSTCYNCYYNLGQVLGMNGKLKESLPYLDKAISMEEDASYYFTRFMVRSNLGDAQGTLQDIDKAISLDSLNSEYYMARGTVRFKLGYIQYALNDLSRAISLDSNNHEAFFQRSHLFYTNEKYNESYNDINIAIALDSLNYNYYVAKGALYEVVNQYENALKTYNKAISIDSSQYGVYTNRSGVLYKMENMDAACEDYRAILRINKKEKIQDPSILEELNKQILDHCDPEQPSYYYQRGIASFNLKKFNNAISYYQEGLKKFPNHSSILIFMGNAHMMIDDFRKARSYYQKGLLNREQILSEIKKNPRFSDSSRGTFENYYRSKISDTFAKIAICYLEEKDYEKARDNIDSALNIEIGFDQYTHTNSLNISGVVHVMMNELDKAKEDLEASIKLNLYNRVSYLNLALTHLNLIKKAPRLSIEFLHDGEIISPIIKINEVENYYEGSNSLIQSAMGNCRSASAIPDEKIHSHLTCAEIKRAIKNIDHCPDVRMAKQYGAEITQDWQKPCLKN